MHSTVMDGFVHAWMRHDRVEAPEFLPYVSLRMRDKNSVVNEFLYCKAFLKFVIYSL
jgi:hypothetical protein